MALGPGTLGHLLFALSAFALSFQSVPGRFVTYAKSSFWRPNDNDDDDDPIILHSTPFHIPGRVALGDAEGRDNTA